MAVTKSTETLASELLAGVTEHGGATLSVWVGIRPTEGYVVALPGHALRIVSGLAFAGPRPHLVATVRGWVAGNASDARRTGYLGIWADGEDVVLDVVEIYGEAAPAIAAGRERGEIAIFCLTDGTEIPTATTEEAQIRRQGDPDGRYSSVATYDDDAREVLDSDPELDREPLICNGGPF